MPSSPRKAIPLSSGLQSQKSPLGGPKSPIITRTQNQGRSPLSKVPVPGSRPSGFSRLPARPSTPLLLKYAIFFFFLSFQETEKVYYITNCKFTSKFDIFSVI